MNRYQIEGILRDLAADKDVLILGETLRETDEAMEQLEAAAPGTWSVVSRANGRRLLTHVSGTTVRPLSRRTAAKQLRGAHPDVIVSLTDFRHPDFHEAAALLSALRLTGAELLLPQ